MKVLIYTCFLFFVLNHATSQTIDLSSGLLFSDITSWDFATTETNKWKYDHYISLGIPQKIWKFIHLKENLTYSERKPLEIFAFVARPDWGEYIHLLGAVPTSFQSKLFNLKEDKLLTDFKYLGLDILPIVKLGKKVQIEAGVGGFYNRLLNFNQTTVRREDLPRFDGFFDAPFNLSGEVTYRKEDYGWKTYFRISYLLEKNFRIGIEGRSYHSLVGIHNPFYSAFGNPRWLIFTSGINIQYLPKG